MKLKAFLQRIFCRPKLYAWQPRGFGEPSFIVAAYSEGDALLAVEKIIARRLASDGLDKLYDFQLQGWGTDYYYIETYEINEVMCHRND